MVSVGGAGVAEVAGSGVGGVVDRGKGEESRLALGPLLGVADGAAPGATAATALTGVFPPLMYMRLNKRTNRCPLIAVMVL